MERNAGNGIALDPVEDQTEGTGENAGASDQSAGLAPLYDRVEQALRKNQLVDALADKDMPLAAMLADLTPGSATALAQRARAANVSQLIGARANISLASQNAPRAFADTGSYAGVIPKPEDFAYVFGVEEGRQQLEKFNQSVETGKQAFDMRVMPVRDINSQLLDAAVGAANSPEGQSRYRVAAAAAQHVLEARRKDPAGEAVKAFPQANEAWRAAAAQGWRDPAAVQNALALTIATQRYLGIENAQPVPRSVLKDLGALPPQDMWAGMNGLLAGTTDPVVKAAVKQQFAEAGLPGGQTQAPTSDRFGGNGGSSKRGGVIPNQNEASHDEPLGNPPGRDEENSDVPQLTPDQRIGQPFQQDLPTDVLLANLAPSVFGNRAQPFQGPEARGLVNPGADVALASQAARAAVSNRSAYSGPRPGPEQFAAAFGAEEGGRQFNTFKRRADVTPYLAEMRTMPANQIDAMLDIDMPARNPFNSKKAPAQYKREQVRYDREMAEYNEKKPTYDLIANAAALILQDRQNDPADYVRQVLPSMDAAWKQISDPKQFGAAVAQSFAAQRRLGIKTAAPLPLAVAKDLIHSWGDDRVTPDAEAAEREVLESVSDPKQRAAVAKQLANVRATQAAAHDGTGGVGSGQATEPPVRQFAKSIDLSPADILRLKKTLMTEWVVNQGDDQAKGIIDTILNRLASKHWGNDISEVVNSWAQFSAVNSKDTVPIGRNNVDQLSIADPRFARASKMADEYLLQRANGASSIVDDNLNYANPKYSSKVNLVWISKLDGPKFGDHWHGTVEELRKYRPGQFGIRLPSEYYRN